MLNTLLLTKLLHSRWLDIGQVLFACLWTETESRFMNTQKKTWPISSHLEWRSFVNNNQDISLQKYQYKTGSYNTKQNWPFRLIISLYKYYMPPLVKCLFYKFKGNSNNDITAIETWSTLLSFYQTFTCFTIRWKVIGHFQVRSSLYFKTSLSAKALWW